MFNWIKNNKWLSLSIFSMTLAVGCVVAIVFTDNPAWLFPEAVSLYNSYFAFKASRRFDRRWR